MHPNDLDQTRKAKLQALCDRLAQYRQKSSSHESHYQRIRDSVRSELDELWLVHGVARHVDLKEILRLRRLESKCLLGRRPSPAQAALGTEKDVCTSAGILYPSRKIALVFSSSVEEGCNVKATPFDTGHFYNGGVSKGVSSPQERDELFDRSLLPSPEYRFYMAEFVASHFSSASAWLMQEVHCYHDQDGFLCEGDFLSGVFEVRFQDVLPLERHLCALFVDVLPDDASAFDLQVLLRELEIQGVEIIRYDGASESTLAIFRKWIMNKRFR